MIRAGKTSEISWANGTWLILDIGFSNKTKSCGLLIHSPKQEKDEIKEVKFSEAVEEVIKAAQTNKTLNLVIEAPLSVAFDENGNPIGRNIDKQRSQVRYWYTGPGCVVMVATFYLMRRLISAKPDGEIRLFEGFASFKTKEGNSKKRYSHREDVERLRKVIRDPNNFKHCIHDPADLHPMNSLRAVESAFKVTCSDFGMPPVIKPDG